MKKVTLIFTLIAIIILCVFFIAQPAKKSMAAIPQQTDSTYTTFTTRTEDGYVGSDTCHHEWFSTVLNETDTALHTVIQITSKQCVKCGKQTSIINEWKTYETNTADTL